MLILYQILLIIHVMAAMLWFGGTVTLPRAARQSLTLERPAATQRIAELLRQARMFGGAAVLVLLTGVMLALMFPGGGFGALPMRYHIALTLTLVWVVIALAVTRPSLKRMHATAESEQALESAKPLAKRLAAILGIQHLLFTISLILMLWRI